MNYGEFGVNDDRSPRIITAEQARDAAAHIARRALNTDDQARLLAMLGLEAAT